MQGRLGDGSVRVIDPEGDRSALLDEIRQRIGAESVQS